MKQSIQLLILICFPLWLSAQATSGSTGLLNIPSAEMQRDGTFMFGSNYLPEEFTPERLSYDSGNYYLNMTFLPFLEINYRLVLLKNNFSSRFTEQDRTFGVKIQLLKERKILPAIVIGGNDIYSRFSDDVNQTFGSFYMVATKKLEWRGFKCAFTLGSGFNGSDSSGETQVNGAFGGLSVSPSFMKQLSLIAEYDSNSLNVGASVLLFKHLYLHAFANDLKYFTGGFAYKIYLKGNKDKGTRIKDKGYRIKETRVKGEG